MIALALAAFQTKRITKLLGHPSLQAAKKAKAKK